jgi:hypothetical protein
MSEDQTLLASVAENVVAQEVDVEPVSSSTPVEEQDVAKKKDDTPAWAEKRLNRITAQKYAARAEADAARKEAADLRARLATYERPVESEVKQGLREEDVQALAEKLADQKVKAREFDNKANELVKQGKKEFKADFDSSVKSLQSVGALFNDNGTPTSLLESVMDCDEPHKVMHFLGSNPDEAEDLLSLSPRAQARAIAKLELKLYAETPASVITRTSKAPAPIKPVGSVSSANAEPNAKDTKAWIAWRNRQLGK